MGLYTLRKLRPIWLHTFSSSYSFHVQRFLYKVNARNLIVIYDAPKIEMESTLACIYITVGRKMRCL